MNIQQSKRPGPPTALRRAPPSCAEGGKSFRLLNVQCASFESPVESVPQTRDSGALSPWLAGASALQPHLAAPAASSPRESAAISRDFGALSPVACWGTGSTAISRGTCRLHPRGKCREFPRFWCTFPRGLLGHRLYSHLSWHLPSPSPRGKCREFPRFWCTFPRGMRLLGRSSRACLRKCLVYRHSEKEHLLDLG